METLMNSISLKCSVYFFSLFNPLTQCLRFLLLQRAPFHRVRITKGEFIRILQTKSRFGRAPLFYFAKSAEGAAFLNLCDWFQVAQQCLVSLSFIHSLGLIHCDLKPENILMKSYNEYAIRKNISLASHTLAAVSKLSTLDQVVSLMMYYHHMFNLAPIEHLKWSWASPTLNLLTCGLSVAYFLNFTLVKSFSKMIALPLCWQEFLV